MEEELLTREDLLNKLRAYQENQDDDVIRVKEKVKNLLIKSPELLYALNDSKNSKELFDNDGNISRIEVELLGKGVGLKEGISGIEDSWLYDGTEWIMPTNPDDSIHAAIIDLYGQVYFGNLTYDSCGIRPTFYLRSTISISDGYGTFDDPYILDI